MFPPGESSNIFRSDNKITYIAWVTYFSTILFVMFCVFWGVLVFFSLIITQYLLYIFLFFYIVISARCWYFVSSQNDRFLFRKGWSRKLFLTQRTMNREKKSTKNKWLLYVRTHLLSRWIIKFTFWTLRKYLHKFRVFFLLLSSFSFRAIKFAILLITNFLQRKIMRKVISIISIG